MIAEGVLQFLAAGIGTVAFSVLFSVPREHYPLCGFIGGTGWLICWIFVHGLGAGRNDLDNPVRRSAAALVVQLRRVTDHGNVRFDIVYIVFVEEYRKWSWIYFA